MNYYLNFSLEPIHYTNQFGEECVEQWKDITEIKNIYQSSDLGRIRSLDRVMTSKIGVKRFYKGKILVQIIDRKGYLVVGLSINTKHQSKLVSRLVAKVHISNPNNLPEVNHCGKLPDGREGNKLDNRAISLKWATSSENSQHSMDNRLQVAKKGEEHAFAKITEIQATKFRNLFFSGISCYRIAKDHSISYGIVYDVIKRNTWKHIP